MPSIPLLNFPFKHSAAFDLYRFVKEKKIFELKSEMYFCDYERYLTDVFVGPWFDMYLEARSPLVLNFNPFIAYRFDDRPEYNDQVSYVNSHAFT